MQFSFWKYNGISADVHYACSGQSVVIVLLFRNPIIDFAFTGSHKFFLLTNRYWGTPIPIWTNGEEFICVGSIGELEALTGKKIDDLHRENIDHLEIPSKIPGKKFMKHFNCGIYYRNF